MKITFTGDLSPALLLLSRGNDGGRRGSKKNGSGESGVRNSVNQVTAQREVTSGEEKTIFSTNSARFRKSLHNRAVFTIQPISAQQATANRKRVHEHTVTTQ